MPVQGWGETAVLTKGTDGSYKLDLKNAFLDANNYNSYKYKFYRLEFRDNTDKSISDLSSWVIKYGNLWSANDVSSETSSNCFLYKNSDNYFLMEIKDKLLNMLITLYILLLQLM